ncbi:MAG: deoxyribodipyrimidine photolyase, partial [Gemmatimonadales bacterium]
LRPCPPLPPEIRQRWSPAPVGLLTADDIPSSLPVDRQVPPVPFRGGSEAAGERLDTFLAEGLAGYHQDRNHPDRGGGSGLSPWLHWGHLSSSQVLERVLEGEGWTPARLPEKATGSREGWWGLGAGAEAFLDELVTWRELGYRTAWHEDDPEHWDRLPAWARETLLEHAEDPRPHVYELAEFEEARTHDPVWNAAQRELRGRGTIHNYMRMLWGKKVLEWTAHPREALRILLHLNNRWAVDGRNPNSTSGISWVLGRYDRGWPEREVFGKVRSMTTRSTRRKVDLDAWLRRWGSTPSGPD